MSKLWFIIFIYYHHHQCFVLTINVGINYMNYVFSFRFVPAGPNPRVRYPSYFHQRSLLSIHFSS